MKKIFILLLLFVGLALSAEVRFTGIENDLKLSASFNNVDLKIHKNEKYSEIQLEDCNPTFLSGFELPVSSQLIDLSASGNYTITELDYVVEEIILEENLSPFQTSFDVDFTKDEWLPNEIIQIGKPAIMRGARFSQISIFPIQYNPARNSVRFYSQLDAEFNIDNSDTRNPILVPRNVTGFSSLNDKIHGKEITRDLSGGNYLVIAPENCADLMQPFLRWKEKLGFKTRLAVFEEIGTTEADIKDYLQTAYDIWETPPEYVLMVGDVTGNFYLPAYYIPGYLYPWCVTDHSFTLLEGDDYFPDILIGRLSFQNEMQLTTMLSKIINYEKNPYLENDWMKSALMTGYVDESNGFSQREVLLTIRDKLLNFEYTKVDTFIAPWQFGATLLENEINNGHSFICYRGAGHSTYWSGGSMGQMFANNNVLNLNNGFMLPMVTSMTCGGGDFAAGETATCFGEVWMFAGTPSVPQGAIGFIGPSERDTKTWFNNANALGIYQGITQEGINSCGEMLLRGKMELYNNFPFGHEMGGAEDSDQFYFYVYNLLGDPGLRVWTDTPKAIELEASEVFLGSNFVSANIITNDDPAEFKVAFTSLDSLVAVGYTDAAGNVNLPISVSEGTYQLTASKYGFIPKTIDIHVQASDMLAMNAFTFSENTVSGQTLDIDLQIMNMADSDADNVTIELNSQDDNISIITDPISVYSIPANQTYDCTFSIEISESWQDGETSDLILEMTSNLGDNLALIPVEIQSPDLAMVQFEALNSSGFIIQEEETDLNLTLYNSGQANSSTFQTELICLNDVVEVQDASSGYNSIDIGENETNFSAFTIFADNSIISGETAEFQLNIFNTSSPLQTIFFEIPIGIISESSPTFCDWGYYAVESSDAGNFDAPDYNWIEIDPELGGNGTLVGADHAIIDGYIQTISLPFQFRYYGQFYDEISICSEGWLAMGRTQHIYFRNRTIPSGIGPDAMIAPFWDSLQDGNIYVAHDSGNHQFIIEWSDWGNSYDPDQKNTFQVILMNPEYEDNFGIDSTIIFQYKEIHNIDQQDHYATIGIENQAQTEGLLLSFAGIEAATFHPIQDETAIMFTMKNGPDVPYLTVEPSEFIVETFVDTIILQTLTLQNNSESSEPLEYSLSLSHFGPGNGREQNLNRNIENDQILQLSGYYIPFQSVNMPFYLLHNSPDGEPIVGVTLDFPAGCTINSAQDIGDLNWNEQTGNGAELTWGYDGTSISPTNVIPFTINLIISEQLIPPLEIEWQIDGDGSGSAPHQASGTISINPTTDEIFWITYPNGGETVLPALQDTIRWNHFGVADSVKIELSRNGGIDWEMLDAMAPNLEFYPHTFNGPLSEDCKVKISTLDDEFFDLSDSLFQISALNITYPDETTVMSYSTIDSILWQDVGGMETIDISISFDNGFSWQILEENVQNSGSYQFEVPGPPSNYCKIKLSNSDHNVLNISEAFQIVDAYVEWLSADNFTGSIPAGETEDIEITFSTANLEFGIYEAYLKIETQIGQVLYIPVSLHYFGPCPPPIFEVQLRQNTPNPFNPFTKIEYEIPDACNVKVSIYNLKGQHVKTLVNEFKTTGYYYEYWDGTNRNNQKVASGMYFYLLKAGNKTKVRKMTLMK
ncbi:MAG: T9SS type A sorting domain-containing protein [Candidatus Cloacimonetes bacterium]|nr:T9SS type A sorting domain-containing protein [Candidatus Cloacimonadota bacterium]MCF7812928.1 T9SS type A sorting domain-containing protein [Candidatus Cloacimonadota bacterium]MCF7867140.1 T9SS type A sorting domain-containing protein [Candidatus Cloacimonadota bacterium]MCF7882540.1 T9SS type A sorting domain-containing protein [Candidatus Cloacimonadota bacterium]